MFMNAHASVQWYAIECKCVASGSAGAAAVAMYMYLLERTDSVGPIHPGVVHGHGYTA